MSNEDNQLLTEGFLLVGGCSFYTFNIYHEQRYCKGVAGNPAPKGTFNYYGHDNKGLKS